MGGLGRLGATEDKENKPQFAPMPKGTTLEKITMEQALKAFELPRLVGQTKDGQDINANIGRFGPYIKVDKLFISIKPLDPHEITHDQALDLYDAKLKAEAEKNIADFGDGIKVLKGRFGPYVTDGKVNATIPKKLDPKEVTLEQAKEMIAEKIKKGPAKRRGGKTTKKSAPKKKATKKKTSVKKKPATKK